MRWLRTLGLSAVIALLLFSLLTPLLFRVSANAPITPGAESYAHLQDAEQFVAGGYNPVVVTPYRLLLGIMVAFGVPWLLPILLAVVFFFLLHSFLIRFTRNKTVSLITLIILAVTPVISILGTRHVPEMLGYVLLLGALLLYDSKKWIAFVLYFLGSITAPVTGGFLLIYFLYESSRNKNKKKFQFYTGVLVLTLGWFYFWIGKIPTVRITLDILNENLLFEFGNTAGISIFLLLMAMYGLVTPRMRNRKTITSVLLLVVFATLVPELIPLTAIALSLAAAHGIVFLVRNKWELEQLRQTLHVLILCLGLFLLVVSMRDRIDEQPTEELFDSLVYLRNQYREGNVLSLPEYAPMIEYFSNHMATLQPGTSPVVFLSRNSKQLYDYLEQTGTSHIIITEDMRESLFSRSDEGILFIVPNTQRFVLVYETSENKLWYYIPRR